MFTLRDKFGELPEVTYATFVGAMRGAKMRAHNQNRIVTIRNEFGYEWHVKPDGSVLKRMR